MENKHIPHHKKSLIAMNIVLIYQNEIEQHLFSFSKKDTRFQHIKKVLKLTKGARFKAGIINGKKGYAEIIHFSDNELTARFESYDSPEPSPPVKLILGFPRPIQLRRIIRDIVCLGIDSVYLTGTALGEKSYLQADIAAPEEIYRLLLDGCAQAGQTQVPSVYKAYSVQQLFTNYAAQIQKEANVKALLDIYTPFYAAHNVFAPLTALPWKGNNTLWLAVGNERGWTDTERTLFFENGFSAYGMGSRILRTETAVTAALAVSLAQAGYWN